MPGGGSEAIWLSSRVMRFFATDERLPEELDDMVMRAMHTPISFYLNCSYIDFLQRVREFCYWLGAGG